ncbi:hypothetical protein IV203_033299 [Nitzschia inconspicua]|uniref:Uncharacterized protein n=1 Tax=Nitzschia inconspicua TaxID=303405 RepID=A0A9K3KMV7_9STRA|nr:hypothetical protein IV203_033299 [Nitzschia inconspicua]
MGANLQAFMQEAADSTGFIYQPRPAASSQQLFPAMDCNFLEMDAVGVTLKEVDVNTFPFNKVVQIFRRVEQSLLQFKQQKSNFETIRLDGHLLAWH